MDKLLIGVVEALDLPELGLYNINTRIDTGAQTSALHVDHISDVDKDGNIHFEFHPDLHNIDNSIHCASALVDTRWIKSSNGHREQRYVIRTLARLGEQQWHIALTLTDRTAMNHLMLLGREAMAGRVIIDPDKTFLTNQ